MCEGRFRCHGATGRVNLCGTYSARVSSTKMPGPLWEAWMSVRRGEEPEASSTP